MKTIVVTTPERVDRQRVIAEELAMWGIPFEFHLGKQGHDRESCAAEYSTAMVGALEKSLANDYTMILEDDCTFVFNPLNVKLPPGNWAQCYLGANIKQQTFKYPHDPNWSILQGAWMTHCVIYPARGAIKVLDEYARKRGKFNVFDDWLRGYFHLKGLSLIYNLPIAFQSKGQSDIEGRVVDYSAIMCKSYNLIAR